MDILKFKAVLVTGVLLSLTPQLACDPSCEERLTCDNTGGTGGAGGTRGMGGESVGGAGGDGGTDLTGAHLWSRAFGDGANQTATTVAIDSQENIIIGGVFTGTIDFGTGPLLSNTPAVFLAKLAPNGTTMWAKIYDASSITVTTDSQDNVIVGGTFTGASLDFGVGPMEAVGLGDIYLAKLDSDGIVTWSHQFGDADPDTLSTITALTDDSIIITGTYEGAINFGGNSFTNPSAASLFIARFYDTGSHNWSRAVASNDSIHSESVGSLVDGYLLWCGNFAGSLNFGGSQLTALDTRDIFLVKLSSADGTHINSNNYNGLGIQLATFGDTARLGVDFSETLNLGGTALNGTNNVAIASFDDELMNHWSDNIGDMNAQHVGDLGTDSDGNTVVALNFSGDFSVQGYQLGGADDIGVLKYEPDGSVAWARDFGGLQIEEANALAVGSDGSTVIVGRFNGAVDFGGGSLSSSGGDDVFVVKLAP